jgi:hypothetical protein
MEIDQIQRVPSTKNGVRNLSPYLDRTDLVDRAIREIEDYSPNRQVFAGIPAEDPIRCS